MPKINLKKLIQFFKPLNTKHMILFSRNFKIPILLNKIYLNSLMMKVKKKLNLRTMTIKFI